jgi:hypothetical protein
VNYIPERLDVTTEAVSVISKRVVEALGDGNAHDRLGALCMVMCWIIDHGEDGNCKQAIYESVLLTMAEIMRVAPGIKK